MVRADKSVFQISQLDSDWGETGAKDFWLRVLSSLQLHPWPWQYVTRVATMQGEESSVHRDRPPSSCSCPEPNVALDTSYSVWVLFFSSVK